MKILNLILDDFEKMVERDHQDRMIAVKKMIEDGEVEINTEEHEKTMSKIFTRILKGYIKRYKEMDN